MQYRYSQEVNSERLDTEGLFPGLPFRVHQSPGRVDLGAIKAQEDWKRIIGDYVNPKTSLSPNFSLLSAAFPETIPERLELIAYLTEYAFLHDDVMESVNQQLGAEQNDEAMFVCEEAGRSGSLKEPVNKTGRGLIMSKIANKMLSMDPGPASTALLLVAEWFRRGAGRRNHDEFDTIEEFIDYRNADLGDVFLVGTTIFGMGLNIPQHELEMIPELCRPAWTVLSLTNDLYSLEKELKEAAENPEVCVSNTVVVIMRERGISQAEAKEQCRQMIRESVAKFRGTVETTQSQEHLSFDLRVFVEAVQYIVTGNFAWSKSTPRFNPGAKYNDRQLEWMMYGTPGLLFSD